MAYVAVRDHALWIAHIYGDSQLVERLMRVPSGEFVALKVDGIAGRWEKMADGKDGRPTNGLKPLAEAKRDWHALLEQRGREVDIAWAGEQTPAMIGRRPGVVARPPVEESTPGLAVRSPLGENRTEPASNTQRGNANLPARVIHADWGIDPSKRWHARALLQPNGRYEVEPAEPVEDLDEWREASRACTGRRGAAGWLRLSDSGKTPIARRPRR